jgi:hypothetical protein
MRAHRVSSFEDQHGNEYGPLDVRRSPGNFFVVASQGKPDFIKGPVAMSTIRGRDAGSNYNNTAVLHRQRAYAELYLAAHKGLVTPFQEYYASDDYAPKVARSEVLLLAPLVRMQKQLTIGAHVVYLGLDDEPASLLLVNRTLAKSRNAAGKIGEYKGPATDCELDLAEIVEQELEGAETDLRNPDSVATRALGVVGLLPTLETVTHSIQEEIFDAL